MERWRTFGRVTFVAIGWRRVWRSLVPLLLCSLIGVTFFGSRHSALAPDMQVLLQQTECAVPGAANPTLLRSVPLPELPWADGFPEPLRALQETYQAHLLMSAYRVTSEESIFDEEANVRVAAMQLAGAVIQPGQQFSLIQAIGPFTTDKGYADGPTYIGGRVVPTTGGGVCKVATAVYNAAIGAGMTIVERHAHSMQVPYAPPGRDAAVAWGYKDLIIQNPYDHVLIVWAQVVAKSLYVAVYGSDVPPEVEWYHEELARRPMPTIYRENSELEPGTQRVLEGYDGVTVRTWIILRHGDGTVEQRDMGTDYYLPMVQIVEYGPEA